MGLTFHLCILKKPVITNGAKVKPSTGSETYKYDLFSNIYRKDAGKITDP